MKFRVRYTNTEAIFIIGMLEIVSRSNYENIAYFDVNYSTYFKAQPDCWFIRRA